MKLLVDTHAYIWWAFEPSKLSTAAATALGEPKHQIYVSVASLWEMSVKIALGKLALPVSLLVLVERLRQESGVATLAIEEAHAFAHEGLADIHRDPFDRMLVAQAASEGLTIVTRDPLVRQYAVPTL